MCYRLTLTGISLVALNYQTAAFPMWINHGKFLVNAQCGYVLKPEHLRSSKKAAPGQLLVPEPGKLKVHTMTTMCRVFIVLVCQGHRERVVWQCGIDCVHICAHMSVSVHVW